LQLFFLLTECFLAVEKFFFELTQHFDEKAGSFGI